MSARQGLSTQSLGVMSVEVTVSSTGAAIARAPKVATIVETTFIVSESLCVGCEGLTMLVEYAIARSEVMFSEILCPSKAERYQDCSKTWKMLGVMRGVDNESRPSLPSDEQERARWNQVMETSSTESNMKWIAFAHVER